MLFCFSHINDVPVKIGKKKHFTSLAPGSRLEHSFLGGRSLADLVCVSVSGAHVL